MPLCHRRKIKFIHIPKTGGTSLVRALDLESTGHHDAWSVYPATTADYVSFTVVRDPIARFVSEYNFGMAKRSYWHIQGTRHEFLDYHILKVMSLEDVVADLQLPLDKRRLKHCGWWPQTWFICDTQKRIRVDHILRQESLNEDLNGLLALLQLPAVTLPRINRSTEELAVADIISNSVLHEKLRQIYQNDYALLADFCKGRD